MEYIEFALQSNELVAFLLAAGVSALVQKAKKAGHDPFLALAVVSSTIALFWSAANQLVPKEFITKGAAMAVEVAAFANLLYNIAKRFVPGLSSKD